jgi:hypothetical protein
LESVIVIAPREHSGELARRLVARWTQSSTGTERWVVDDGQARIYISRNDFVGRELEPERLARIIRTIPDPVFYTVDFSDLQLCRDVLAAIADDPALLVDNDHGVILSGAAFVDMLRTRREWDWRRER